MMDRRKYADTTAKADRSSDNRNSVQKRGFCIVKPQVRIVLYGSDTVSGLADNAPQG